MALRKYFAKNHHFGLSIRLCSFLIFLLLVAPYAFCTEKTADKPLTIVCDDRFPPFEFSEDGKLKGFAVDLVKAVFNRMEVPYRIETYPWKRAESMVVSGQADALFSASYLKARSDVCWYSSEHLFESEYVFFIHKQDKNNLYFGSFEDLKFKHICVTLGYSYNESFWAFLKENGNYTETVTDEQSLLMLANRRCDYCIIEKNVGKEIVKTMNQKDNITYIPKAVIQKPYFMIFNKNQTPKSLADRFSKELKLFKTTEEYKKIYSTYF